MSISWPQGIAGVFQIPSLRYKITIFDYDLTYFTQNPKVPNIEYLYFTVFVVVFNGFWARLVNSAGISTDKFGAQNNYFDQWTSRNFSKEPIILVLFSFKAIGIGHSENYLRKYYIAYLDSIILDCYVFVLKPVK